MFAETPASPSTPSAARARELGASRLSRWTIPLLDRATARICANVPAFETALSWIEPTLSLRSVRARVVSIVDETSDTKTYWLRPNARFKSFRAGEFVDLQLTIGGRPVTRSYSLSSAPRADRLISITVKRVPNGLVSNWLADRVRPGHVLTLGSPRGRFVLPSVPAQTLLMLSA
ncbi:MAG TPA: FAD-binding oxidoreductase, partial [Polyangiales bacterium]